MVFGLFFLPAPLSTVALPGAAVADRGGPLPRSGQPAPRSGPTMRGWITGSRA